MKKSGLLLCLLIFLILVSACTPAEENTDPTLAAIVETELAAIQQATEALPTPAQTLVQQVTSTQTAEILPTETIVAVTPTETPDYTPTPETRIPAREWTRWPIIPVVSETAKQIYLQGLEMGNNPNVFSTIGDCQSEPNVFLGIYETSRYALGAEDVYLQETIDHFYGSFSRQSLAVRDGLSAPSALSVMWADPQFCAGDETPVTCELRTSHPSIMFINLGTNWRAGASADEYEKYLRQIVEQVIDNGTVPILSTKADNVEGDYSINKATAQVAYDYDIPLWNFWLAADSLPGHGLDGSRDGVYLTPDGWDRRNITGIKVLDAVWRELKSAAGEGQAQ